jgi:hypothetical protein
MVRVLLTAVSLLIVLFVCSSAWGADAPFFPDNVFSQSKGLQVVRAKWFASHLKAMGEMSLYSREPDKDVSTFRLLWLRNNEAPIMVRLDNANGLVAATFVQTTGKGGYYPGTVDIRRTRKLSTDEWNRVMGVVRQMDFWKLSPAAPPKVLDGDYWLLEGHTQDRYHVVNRDFVSPEYRPDPANEGFLGLCSLLADLMGFGAESCMSK